MARSADFDLARELAKPSFTPGARDAAALVALVVAGDEPAATRAQAALARLGEPGRQAALVRLADSAPHDPTRGGVNRAASPRERGREGPLSIDDPGGHARLIAVLGLLARAGDGEARAALLARAGDPVPRLRKAAAVALGKLGDDDGARTALVARWDAGDATPEERRALAEALGKLGGDAALARLRALDAHDDAELARRRDRAVLMADRSARRDVASSVVGDVAPPSPLAIQLTCRPGLGALLVDELTSVGFACRPVGDRGAELTLAQPLSVLFASRLWASLAIQLALPTGELAPAITRTLTSPAVLGVLRAWTRGPIRWRLGFAHGHKRAIVWQVARDVTAAEPALINDPTATTWDVVVDDGTDRGTRGLALVPRRLDDPRFAYRVAEVPAASHPTVAAALAWLAAPRPGERAWDPFCGSGLELIECARRAGGALELRGTDLAADALDAARANLAAAGVTAELAIADARDPAPAPVDLIVSNPPLGSRVQLDAVALLIAALPGFARTLAPRGRLVWITPSPRKTSPAAEQLGLVRSRAYPVDLGGVRGQLERWDRR